MGRSLVDEIHRLKQERNAIILAHNYQRPEVQDIADHVGDSFGLSMVARSTNADVIVFAGVDFMAESAKILNPGKVVIHPDVRAICPMARMVDVEGLRKAKSEIPDAAIVSYVNTPAFVKAESDYCCTSTNAIKLVRSIPESRIIFVPDSNLGMYVRRMISGEKEIYLWPGYCPTHVAIKRSEILELKKAHPEAEVVVHPECVPEVIELADAVKSTEGMVKYCGESKATEFIIGTERELIYRLKRLYPEKVFYAPPSAVCPNMKRITLQNIRNSLHTLTPRIELPEDILKRAFIPLERMISIGRGE
jgi:quinolinate synthase